MSNKKSLAILGMHRSGTSLLTHWLMNSGLHFGDQLLGPGESNKKGHFEDLDFLNIQQEILRDAGLNKNGLINVDKLQIDDKIRARLELFIADKQKYNSKILAWKEPRSVLFIEVYDDLIPNLYSIVVFRPYWEVVDSLIRREKRIATEIASKQKATHFIDFLKKLIRKRKLKSFEKKFTNEFLKTWIVYNQALLNHILKRSQKTMVIELSDIHKLQYKILDHLNSWGIDATYSDFAKVYDEKLLKQSDQNKYVFDSDLESEAKKIYSLLRDKASFQ